MSTRKVESLVSESWWIEGRNFGGGGGGNNRCNGDAVSCSRSEERVIWTVWGLAPSLKKRGLQREKGIGYGGSEGKEYSAFNMRGKNTRLVRRGWERASEERGGR